MTHLLSIPGIGKTFVKDFARIDIVRVEQLAGQSPEALFERLVAANAAVQHKTSQNYLYVLRMAVYYANGGRDPARLKWHVWKDRTV
jgi:predicted RecB family nuclease